MYVFRVFFGDGTTADVKAHSAIVVGSGDLYFFADEAEKECGYFEAGHFIGYAAIQEVADILGVGERIKKLWQDRRTPVGFDVVVRMLEGVEGDFFKEWVTMLREARTGREKREAMGACFESLEWYVKGVVEDMEELESGEKPDE